MDWLGWIPSLFSWFVRQGRITVIVGMYMAVLIVAIYAIVLTSDSENVSIPLLLFFVATVPLVPLPIVVRMLLDAETRQKRDELEYGRRKKRPEDGTPNC